METLQSSKQNGMVIINNNYKVSKNEYKINEDKSKQIHSQIKMHNEHLKNITKIDKYKKTGAQNGTQLDFGEPRNKYTQIQQRRIKRNWADKQ